MSGGRGRLHIPLSLGVVSLFRQYLFGNNMELNLFNQPTRTPRPERERERGGGGGGGGGGEG